GQILLAYLPTSRLEHITIKVARRQSVTNLFHACMKHLVVLLEQAGLEGIMMESGDGMKCCATIQNKPLLLQPTMETVQLVLQEEMSLKFIHVSTLIEISTQFSMLLGWSEPMTGFGTAEESIIWIFHKGISTLSRVSRTEHKQMASFILSVITDIPSLTPNQSNMLLAATRALLDFLYLASYPIHSSESLALLEKALDSFHQNWNVFIELQVRANFNLPKLYFLSHYMRAIKYYGTMDNYNTETTERLHINLAKDAYWAFNRKDEYAQMTRWLEHREKIFHHTNYVAWRLSTAHSDLDSHAGSSTATSLTPATSTSFNFDTNSDFLSYFHSQSFYWSTAGFLRCSANIGGQYTQVKAVALSKLQDTGPSGYHAVHFEHTLKHFLVQYCDPFVSLNQLDDYAHFVILPFSSLPVWHKVKFINMALYGSKPLDYVCAQPCRYNCDDTRIGWIRVVFSIPNNRLDTLLPANVPLPTHLAYVEWFTKFARSPEAFSDLYRVKRNVLADGKIAASILPLEWIMRSVHLFPKWGGTVPPEWTSESVLDGAPSFTVNVFKDNQSSMDKDLKLKKRRFKSSSLVPASRSLLQP
ncbi:hypothetical protein EV361DRAFT_874515, partial [Lentinula raphanica]